MFQANQFGHNAYRYEPKFDEEIERHPDKRPSSSLIAIESRGRELIWVLEVRGCGALMMRASSDSRGGKLQFNGVSTFTDEEILFEPRTGVLEK